MDRPQANKQEIVSNLQMQELRPIKIEASIGLLLKGPIGTTDRRKKSGKGIYLKEETHSWTDSDWLLDRWPFAIDQLQ